MGVNEEGEWITLVDFSGNKIPAFVFEGGTIFSTRIRLSNGTKRFAIWRRKQKEAKSDGRRMKRVKQEIVQAFF